MQLTCAKISFILSLAFTLNAKISYALKHVRFLLLVFFSFQFLVFDCTAQFSSPDPNVKIIAEIKFIYCI